MDTPEHRRAFDVFMQDQVRILGATLESLRVSIEQVRAQQDQRFHELSLLIAKMPPPLTLTELKQEFVTRPEMRGLRMQELEAKYVTKTEWRPYQRALTAIAAMVLAAVVGALLALVFGR